MDLKNSSGFNQFKWLIGATVLLIVLLLAFQLGFFVGSRKARFSYRWGENYHRAFGGPPGGILRDFRGQDFISGHGTAGTIAKIENNGLIIKGQDGVEKTINIATDTAIKKGRTDIKISDLKVDDQVVVIGSPKDNGSIDAKIIRIFDINDQLPMPMRPIF